MEVSVIIPTYNRKRFLKEAILSVLNQTYKHFELIIYDDGSNDGTDELIRSFKRFYDFKYIFSHENRGPSYARNRAVENANGEFIAFLDSDDLWTKNKLKIQMEYMKKNNCSICQTEEIWIRNGKIVNPMIKHTKPSGFIFERCLELCVVSPSSVVIKKKLFLESGGFDESLPACEDYDLWLRLSLKMPIYLIDKKLVIKRGGHSDQLSRNIPYLDRFRVYSMTKLLENYHLDTEKMRLLKKSLIEKCTILCNGLKKKEKLKEAKYYEQLLAKHGIERDSNSSYQNF